MNFIKLPKELFFDDRYKELSISAKVLYAFLLDRVSLSQKNNLVDENGRVFIYFTRQEASEILDCSVNSITKYINQLKRVGLVCEKKRFIGAGMIYVYNLFDSQNLGIGSKEIVNTNSQNLGTTNTDINKTDISQSTEDGKLLFKILQNCELEIWFDGTGEMLRNIITELFYMPCFYINGARYQNSYIRSKLTGLTADALIRVVDTLKGKSVKNVHAYMLSAVLNAADDYAADLIINS